MPDRIYFLISIPEEFKNKFVSFLKNLNAVNDIPPIEIESVYTKKYAAVPKSNVEVGDGS